MTRTGIFLLGLLSLVSSNPVLFPVPDPYRWDESFTVDMPQFDDEHRGLFNGIHEIEMNNNEVNLKKAIIKYHDHFALEESMFEQTMPEDYVADHKGKHSAFLERFDAWKSPVSIEELEWAKNWLVQHIKNTDFKYKIPGGLPHHLNTPYAWDDSLEVFYHRLDAEHKVLFDLLREVGHDPESTKALTDLKFKMRAHFDYESGIFCNSDTYKDCAEHKAKHDFFYQRLYSMANPVAKTDVDWAKNWLVQHIKNTDFQYKFKLNNYLHEVPRPYIWQESFKVHQQRLDDEHVVLFDAIRDSVDHPDDAAKYDHLKHVMKDHFDYEQGEFKKIPNFEEYSQDHINKHNNFLALLDSHSVPLDCDFINYVETWLVQHIKNTDFAYRAKLVYDVPSPYIWKPSLAVFYKRLDDEHVGLFECLSAVEEHPGDLAVVASCKTKLRMHFDYEETEFCAVADYDCYGHYLKHYKFQTKFQSLPLPLQAKDVAWAQNWLVQHIMNTDHAYKGKLHERRHYVVPEPYVWDKSFLVDIEQLDDEHVGLFDVIREVEAHRDDPAVWEKALKLYNEHFRNEEAMFSQILDNKHDIADHRARHLGVMQTIEGAVVPITHEITDFIKNWLAQHIKNTDFDYKGKMPKIYPIPAPYKWDASFAVEYAQMDAEHKPLFACVADLEHDPNNVGLAASCLKSYEDHFAHEESLFSKSSLYPDEEKYQHKNKHNTFLATMRGLGVPVAKEWFAFAKNWLVQHIKNTDFRYKNMMPHPVSSPLVWDESFEVFYTRLDAEHKILFDLMQKLQDNPDSVDILNENRDWFRDHFDYEEKQFMACGEPCGADAHKKKHDIFFKTLTWVTNPVSFEYMEYAKNWLAQHIKNTDFKYKYKLPTQHKVPRPYVWNKEFEVAYKRLDDEHVGLFQGLRAVEENPEDQESIDNLQKLMRDHFYYEETQFCDSLDLPWDYCKEHKAKHVKFSERFTKMNHAPVKVEDMLWAQDWLVQHIKNTDFGYKGHLKHVVPEPYKWDETFAVDYARLDSEHDVLFANILAVSQDPSNAAKLEELKQNMKQHFLYEEDKFCSVESFNCVDHRMKHYKFWVHLEDAHVPFSCEEINWTKNWLAQHIKNTDHQYKERLVMKEDEGTNFSFANLAYPIESNQMPR